jgi:hypothetical protein
LATFFREVAMEPAPKEEHRSTSSREEARPQHRPRGRLRAAYFGASAFWGFVTGSAAVVGALRATGQGVPLSGGALALLGVTAVVAVAGGLVLAFAYREATQRRRR